MPAQLSDQVLAITLKSRFWDSSNNWGDRIYCRVAGTQTNAKKPSATLCLGVSAVKQIQEIFRQQLLILIRLFASAIASFDLGILDFNNQK